MSGRRASKHSQERSTASLRPLGVIALMVVGTVAAGWAWFYLVGAAIDFVRVARGGQGLAWALMCAASLGAVVCAVLVMSLVARVLQSLGVISEYKPRRAAGRRRG